MVRKKCSPLSAKDSLQTLNLQVAPAPGCPDDAVLKLLRGGCVRAGEIKAKDEGKRLGKS